jgi:RNA polymerase sigma-70 factor (ECF subfamily)
MSQVFQDVSEEQLMAWVQNGDMDAFEALARRLEPRLFSFVYGRVHDRETSEDLVQETLLRLFKFRDRFRDGSRVSTWVFTIALNLCRDHFRRRRPEGSLSDEANLAVAERSRYANKPASPEQLAVKREASGLLVKALGELPAQTQELFRLHGEMDMTFEQAGKKLGISATSARSLASRAYKKLKEKLADLKDEL